MHDLEFPLLRVFRTTEELNEPENCELIGEIPDWIQGTFIRVGPGVFDLNQNTNKEFQLNHIFDGYSILSKFEIHGRHGVKFHKKFLESDSFQRAKTAGKPTVCEFGTRAYPDPTKGFFSRFLPNIVPPLSDNCNMCPFKIANRMFTTTQTSYIREVDQKTLKTGEKFDSLKLFGINSLSCHPLTDETGAIFNVGPSMMTGLKHNILRIPPPSSSKDTPQDLLKRAKVIASIPSSWNGLLSFNHSFGMTKNYIIIVEHPYVFVAAKVLGGILTKNLSIMDWIDFRKDLKPNFLVIEKATGKLVKTEFQSQNPFFMLHVINAYEEKGNIVLDISMFPNPNIFHSMTVKNMRSGNFHEEDLPQGARFVLPIIHSNDMLEDNVNLITGLKTTAKAIKIGSKIQCTPEVFIEPGLELPSINPKFLSKKYNYYYSTGSATNGVWRNTIAKIDQSEHEVKKWQKSQSYYVGEPVFVPRPNATTEDDGVLLSAVTTDGKTGEKDFLVILDAKMMTEIGRVYVDAHMPQGVHGIWIPDRERNVI